MVDPVLNLRGLTKRYGPLNALDGIDVRLQGGRIGLLGPNGAGKSTLVKAVLGLVQADAGDVRVLGRDAHTDALQMRRRIGYMPENECFFPGDTAVEATALAARLCGLPPDESMARAHEVLYYVGLDEARYRPVKDFSTGMRQRVKLAQAIVHDPDLLLLDEPTSGMDPAGREEMLDLIVQLWERRGAGTGNRPVHVILSTHLLPDVERTCDHVLLLHRGRIRFDGPLASLTAGDPGELVVGVKEDADRFAEALRGRGCQVEITPTRELHIVLTGPTAGEPSNDPATNGTATNGTALVWELALELNVQVRRLEPRRVSLDEAFVRLIGDSDLTGDSQGAPATGDPG